MQFSIKVLLAAFLVIPLTVLYFGASAADSKPNKSQNFFGSSNMKKSTFRKISAPFSTQSSFSWIDQEKGIGRIDVVLTGESFVDSTWSYQWKLPEGALSTNALAGDFQSPMADKALNFQLEVTGLDPQNNQNIIFQLKPNVGIDQRMAKIISTHFDQTLEGEVAKQNAAEEEGHSLRKSTKDRSKGHKGIQF